MACRCGSSLMLRSLLARASFIGAQLGVRGLGLYCGVRDALVAWAAAAAPGLPHELGPASVNACCCSPGRALQALYGKGLPMAGPADGGAGGACGRTRSASERAQRRMLRRPWVTRLARRLQALGLEQRPPRIEAV